MNKKSSKLPVPFTEICSSLNLKVIDISFVDVNPSISEIARGLRIVFLKINPLPK